MKNIVESYALSPMQQGMLFHSQYAPGSGVDIEQIVCELNETIIPDLFCKAWMLVVDRHPILRTNFKWEELEVPIQEVHEKVNLPFFYEDLSAIIKKDQQKFLDEYCNSDRKQGFDLSAAPLMRVKLLKLSEKSFTCIWTFHHILLDGRSFPIILNEVFKFYNKFINNENIDLPVPKPYGEYIKWLQDQDESKSIFFWKKYLEGFKSPTSLNFNKFEYEPQELNTGYDVVYHHLNESLTKSIVKFANENSLTPYTIVLAAWALLLYKYSGNEDVLLGATRSNRRDTIEGSDDMVGLFINTLPVRIKIKPESEVLTWLKEIREELRNLREHEQTHLMQIQKVSEVHQEKHLFESILVFENYLLESYLRAQGGEWLNRNFKVLEQTNYPITLFGYLDKKLSFKLEYDKSKFSRRSADSINKHLESMLIEIVNGKDKNIWQLSFITAEEKNILLNQWNNTEQPFESDVCINELFERMVKLYPDKEALVVKDQTITYSDLNIRANQVARKLISLGVGPNTNVGICITRSIEMLAAILGTHKAGGAYLPLDPAYPAGRLQFMADDAKITVLITQTSLLRKIPKVNIEIILLDSDFSAVSSESENNVDLSLSSSNLAYLIYTSGSTGKPKGVKVTHRNVINFFTGMDPHISYNDTSVWLAVTSLSFDISVLELLWTLTRGFKVVIYSGDDLKVSQTKLRESLMDFSLFYFSSYEGEKNSNKYKLLLEGSKYADQNNFNAVWTPERHFYDFGGLYPNPSITSAAIATITKNIKIRAGSVVSPLHNTIRIAEEWSMVDNLSQGRVGISFAAGWQPNDFVIMPENFEDRKDLMFHQIEEVQKLWQGETIGFKDPNGKVIQINILPKPVQKQLPVWVTAAGNPETFEMAGKRGYNLLTHLLGQSISELAEKINTYRKAWEVAGHKGNGTLTLMLHTFVGTDEKMVKETVRGPMKSYLKSAVNLVKEAAWSFPVFKNATTGVDGNFSMDNLSTEDLDAILDYSFERYYLTSGLFGTLESCKKIINRLKEIDVDEIACLIDFGVDSELVLTHLYYLNQLKRESNIQDSVDKYSIASLIKRHAVTHLQCTPSMAKMLMLDKQSIDALASLRVLLVGGEAFPQNLAIQLKGIIKGDILNMYGPTETTIWSAVHKLETSLRNSVPIGRPIVNTKMYILNNKLQPNPIGVPGELCIGGEGVTNGYFNRPEITADRFVDDYFSVNPHYKIYRTGDLACYLSDGTIKFLGRLDHQVKIRGYRIEMGEIETLLSSHPEVNECVVIAREDIPGDQRLVAYIIPKKSDFTQNDSLLDILKENLPDFMIPTNFIFLDKFPLTSNGKIDRKAFPAPSEKRTFSINEEFVKPSNELEMTIASIWQDLLKLAKIGTNDNFFDSGGHSLLAVQLHARLKQVIDPELTLIDIFTYPTINSLAEFVSKKVHLVGKAVVFPESKRAEMTKQRISRLKSRGNNNSDDKSVHGVE